MSAQNRAVTRALRQRFRPRLAAAGFQDFTGRKAWRRTGDVVEVVNVQGIGGYTDVGVGSTSFSFGVFAAVRYPECQAWGPDAGRYTARPDYPDCTFLVVLGKGLRQPDAFHPWGREVGEDRADVWAVDEDLSNVEDVVEDAAHAFVTAGLPLLAEFSSPERAYAALLTRESTEPGYGSPGVHMPGAPGSPNWTRTVRGLAGRLGRDADADIAAAPVLVPPRP